MTKREISPIEYKKLLIDMLVVIDEYCATNNLSYFLAYGSLLGAVRHQGFIPWDDDIDIMMPRADYEVFISSFNVHSPNNDLEVVNHQINNSYYLPYAKVIHKKTEVSEYVRSNLHIGVFVDVFPLDTLPGTIVEAKRAFHNLSLYRALLSLKNLSTRKERSLIKNIIVALGNALLIMIPRSFIIKVIDKRAKKYINYKESHFLANAVLGVYGNREIMPSEWFIKFEKTEFEGHLFKIPRDYHLILSQLYGDYMSLPPVEDRETHHGFIAWWK